MIRPSGLLLVVSHLFAFLVLVLWVGLEKSEKTKLGCEKYFNRVPYQVPLKMLKHKSQVTDGINSLPTCSLKAFKNFYTISHRITRHFKFLSSGLKCERFREDRTVVSDLSFIPNTHQSEEESSTSSRSMWPDQVSLSRNRYRMNMYAHFRVLCVPKYSLLSLSLSLLYKYIIIRTPSHKKSP